MATRRMVHRVRSSVPDDDLLAGLNPVQREAVTHHDGPLLVVAGAGSGKTRVLTHRIAHLIRDHGVSPFEILAITFTNKAADEMKQRVEALVGPVAQKMWVSTFHSACVRILRREAAKLEYPSNFTIYDQADAVRLVGYVVRDLGLDPKRFPPRAVHAAISAAKNDDVSAAVYRERAAAIFERKIGDVFVEYQQRLHKAGAMDFDDLLQVTATLLRQNPDVLDHYRRRFRHILVDEYQDTNKVQNELVLALASEHRNICVVGDTDQSIYRLQGRRHPQHPRVRGGVPRLHGDRARAELPVDADDPRCRQRGDRQQPRPQAEGAVDRQRRRAAHRPVSRRRRVRRGAVGRPRDQPPARRG